MYKFSSITKLFYQSSLRDAYINAGTWPDESVDVNDETFSEFTQQPPEGKVLGADDKGFPVWLDIPPLTQDEIIRQAEADRELRIDQANDYMNNKQWPGKAAIGRLKGEELERYNIWLDYLDALSSLDISHGDISWPEKPETR